MDFLDPSKKKAHLIRLFIGYFLMAVLIGLAALILLFYTYGYSVDPKTGNVIQNGLMFLSSKPSGAEISLNGQTQKDRTDARLSLPADHYDVDIKLNGYRPWHKSVNLEGGTIENIVYPMLFPENLTSQESQLFAAAPTVASQSLDRRWMVITQTNQINQFQHYDLNDPNVPATQISFATNLFSNFTGIQQVIPLEWSSDNRHLLVEHLAPGSQEFLVLDFDSPNLSVNLNKFFNVNPTTVSLRDKVYDHYYLYFKDGGTLQTASLASPSPSPFLSGVISYKSHGPDVVLYAANGASSPDKIRIMIREGAQSYILHEVAASSDYLLDVARFNNDWYYAAGSKSEGKVYIYKNPTSILKKLTLQKALPVALLKVNNPSKVSFSANTRFIALEGGQQFAVYDAETIRQYKFDVTEPLGSLPASWMDGHRLVSTNSGKVIVFEFDGANLQKLNSTSPSFTAYFNKDYTALYTLNNSAQVPSRFALFRTPLVVK